MLLGAVMTTVFTWYRGPMDQLTGHLADSAAFDFEGVALTACLLCAFAFGFEAPACDLLHGMNKYPTGRPPPDADPGLRPAVSLKRSGFRGGSIP